MPLCYLFMRAVKVDFLQAATVAGFSSKTETALEKKKPKEINQVEKEAQLKLI